MGLALKPYIFPLPRNVIPNSTFCWENNEECRYPENEKVCAKTSNKMSMS